MTTEKKRPIFRKKKEEKEKKEDVVNFPPLQKEELDTMEFNWTINFDDVFSSGEEDNN